MKKSAKALELVQSNATESGAVRASPQLEPALAIKLFSDGADLPSMLAMAARPEIRGLTTNPTLMKQAGIKDYRAFGREVLRNIKDKPISFEVLADDSAQMRRQAEEIAGWGDNVYVKIPITNSEGKSSQKLIHDLSLAGVKLNVTAILTLNQVWETCQSLKGGAASIISVFAGRIADTGRDPLPLMRAAVSMCRGSDPAIELLWASSREVLNLVHAVQSGCDIITMTPDLIKKTAFFGKDLDVFSLETVLMFKRDAELSGFTL